MKKHLAFALGLMLLAVAVAGCGKSSSLTQSAGDTNGTAVETANVQAALATDVALINDEISQDETPMLFDGSPSGALAIIRPYRWWRHITSVDRTFTTEFSDPDSTGRPRRALVTVNSTLLGKFNIIAGDTAAGDTTRRLVQKPLEDFRVRKLVLIRVPMDSTEDDSLRREWRVVGTSGVTVTSRNAVTRIRSIRVQAGALDTLITNPLELYRTRRVFFVPPNTPVTMTVTTQAASDLVMLNHDDRRIRFRPNGDGTFTANWMTGDHPGLRHFGVQAFSRGTIFDDEAPYDHNAWILPFAPRRGDCDIEHRN